MDPADAVDDEMRRHSRSPVPPLDPSMVERILDGAAPAEDVPPDYRDVLRVLAAATAPAAPVPSAEAAALAAFRSTRSPVDSPRRKSVLSKLLGAKALVAVVLGTASVGTAAAAATGVLPDSAQATVHRVVAKVPDAGGVGSGAGSGAGSRAGSHADATARPETSGAGGKDGTPAGAAGLCQAYGSGQGGEKGGRLDSAGFERLSHAAGGADRVPAYCATVTATARTGAGQQAGLAGSCRSWRAASREGRTATLGTAVLDRLTAAAGGPASIATYCTELVGPDPAGHEPAATGTPAAVDDPGESQGGSSGGERSAPSHPAPTPARPTHGG
jgi:hypothetical protein